MTAHQHKQKHTFQSHCLKNLSIHSIQKLSTSILSSHSIHLNYLQYNFNSFFLSFRLTVITVIKTQ